MRRRPHSLRIIFLLMLLCSILAVNAGAYSYESTNGKTPLEREYIEKAKKAGVYSDMASHYIYGRYVLVKPYCGAPVPCSLCVFDLVREKQTTITEKLVPFVYKSDGRYVYFLEVRDNTQILANSNAKVNIRRYEYSTGKTELLLSKDINDKDFLELTTEYARYRDGAVRTIYFNRLGGQTAAPKISRTAVKLRKGKSFQLKITGTKESVKWTSSNKNIVRVTKSGKITARKAGTAYIRATAGTKKCTCKVTVIQPVTKIKLNKNFTAKKGKKYQLKATVYPKDASNKRIRWKSSDKKVATVSSKGVVKIVGKGSCVITAAAKDGSGKKASCKITVKK